MPTTSIHRSVCDRSDPHFYVRSVYDGFGNTRCLVDECHSSRDLFQRTEGSPSSSERQVEIATLHTPKNHKDYDNDSNIWKILRAHKGSVIENAQLPPHLQLMGVKFVKDLGEKEYFRASPRRNQQKLTQAGTQERGQGVRHHPSCVQKRGVAPQAVKSSARSPEVVAARLERTWTGRPPVASQKNRQETETETDGRNVSKHVPG